MARTATITRNTKETQINLTFHIDGTGDYSITTPLPFLTHMLEGFTKHGIYDLRLDAKGDTEIDGHHTVEDTGLVLGSAYRQALGDKKGIDRYGWATLPMDETLVTCAVDFCGRPAFVWQAPQLTGKWVGNFDCDLAKEFFAAFANKAECNLHIRVHYGENAHHITECIFKAFAKATMAGAKQNPRLVGQVPSTKGTLTE